MANLNGSSEISLQGPSEQFRPIDGPNQMKSNTNLYTELDPSNVIGKHSIDSRTPFLPSKRTGWKGMSSLEKSLSIALSLVSILALALMIAVIIVGVKLNKDDYKPPEKLTEATLYPPWVTTIPTTTKGIEVTTRERPTTQLTSTTPIPSPAPNNDTASCSSDHCLEISSSLDVTVNPCDNFYNFACGGWTMQNPVSKDYPFVDQFSKLQESFEKEVKYILELVKSDELELEEVEIAKQFYETCLNDNTTNDEVNAAILNLIEEMMVDLDYSSGDLIPVLSKMRKELDANYIFNMWVDVHIENNSQNAIYMDHGNFEVLDEILTSINETDRLNLYKDFMVYLWEDIFPEDMNISQEIVNAVVEFELKLLQISRLNTTDEENDSFEIISNAKALESDNYTMILQFINQTLTRVTDECSDNNTCTSLEDVAIIFHDVQYFATISTLLNETDFNTTVNYLKWRIMLEFGKHSNEDFRELYEQNILGLKMSKPRWEMCVDETIRFFGPPLVAEYIQANIPNPVEFKQQVLEISDYLKHTALQLTQEATWIASNSTRDIISQKLKELEIFALYPLSLTDENITAVLDYYSSLNLTNASCHLQNMIDLTRWQSDSELKLVWGSSNEIMERKELEIQTSHEVVYSYLTNSLYLPTLAVRPPFYHNEENGSMAFSYGSIGTLIGRQLIEALEETAMSYYEGSPVGVWDEETLTNFQKSTDCMKDQYNAYNVAELVDNVTINGESTVKMNSLDLGGFKIALKSYWYTKGLLDESGNLGLKYSPEQLFFIGFAQTWCASYTEDKLIQEITQGSQTPVPYRVNAVVENFEEFSQTWNCPKPIQPNVCHLW